MSNSLVKFTGRKDGNGRGQLYWERADIDGLPFRGHNAPGGGFAGGLILGAAFVLQYLAGQPLRRPALPLASGST